MCLLGAICGVYIAGMDNNILTQVGLIVLVGLASKNAILIVEFVRQKEHEGMPLYKAASEAASLRLRPILMTSFAFILDVVPLVISTSVFYVLCRKLSMLVKGQQLDEDGRMPVAEKPED